MSSSNSVATPTSLNSNPSFDQDQWVIQILRLLDDEELEDDAGIPVSIFNVPKALVANKPEAYTPQQVAIGPYHHWRSELYEMERYKLSAAKRTQKQLPSLKFKQIADRFLKHENRIRSHYHRYLDFNGETLAWMVAIDAAFLLEFLQSFSLKEGTTLQGSSRMSHLIDIAGRKSTHNTILRDILMLENQIPLFLLRKILSLQYGVPEESEEILSIILTKFLKEVTPFKQIGNFSNIQLKEHTHLLHLLYFMLVPKSKEQREINQADNNEATAAKEDPNTNLGPFQQILQVSWKMVSSLKGRPIAYIKKAVNSRPVKLIVKLPWTLITKLPVISILKQPVENIFSVGKEKSEDDATIHDSERDLLIEEITIPSASELIKVGFRFAATTGDISTISFDQKTLTFYLPVVSLDVNTEVILRNLVAYEASRGDGPLVFTRYTELMNGIIDTDEDVKLLRESKIVLNGLKTDGEVAELWNGMSKSLKLSKVPSLDKVIEDVNRYYNSRWKVKVGKFMKNYVFGSWKFLTLLAAILLLLLNGLQAFCSVYSCARWFNVTGLD